MAYYVGTKEFPSVYAAVRYLAQNPQEGVEITSEPVESKPAPATKEGMLTGTDSDPTKRQPGETDSIDPNAEAPVPTTAPDEYSEVELPPPSAPEEAEAPPPTPPPPPPPSEPEGVTTFTFFEGVELGDANPDFLYKRGDATQVTKVELREYFNAQGSGMLKRAFGDFDNYLAYMTEREQLIESGDYDVGNWDEYTGSLTEDELMILEGEDLTQYSDSDQDAYTEAYGQQMQEQSSAYDRWVNSEANQALLAKYGVGSTIYNNDGDKYEWNGSAYVKTVKQDQAGLVDYVKMGIVTAMSIMTGGAVSAVAPSLGTVGSSVVSNAIIQGITTGSIDPDELLQTAATAGFSQALNQVIGPALSEAMGGLDISEITGIEELDNVLNAMGQTAIRQAVFDGELDMEGIVASGLLTGAQEVVEFLFSDLAGQQAISEEQQRELEERFAEYAAIVDEDTMAEVNRVMGNTVNEAIAGQQNEAMRNQLQALAGNLQSIYEEAYDVSPQPSGPSLEDFMASSVDDADSELADTTADLTTDTTVQPEPMAEITNPFEGDELINGVYYNDAGFPVGISPDATPEQILEQFVNDKNAWTTTSGVSAHGLPPEAIAVLMQDGDLQGLSDLLVENNLILAQDSGGGYILISGSEATTGFHTSLDQDALLNLDPPSNERIVPPPTSTDPALDPMDTSDVSPEIRDILLDVQEAPTAPLEAEVEVEPFEYEEEPELTPEPPPEPEPVEQEQPQQSQGEEGAPAPAPAPAPVPPPPPPPPVVPPPPPPPPPVPPPEPPPEAPPEAPPAGEAPAGEAPAQPPVDPSTGQPVTGQPSAQPVEGQPVEGQPVTGEPTSGAGQPADTGAATGQPPVQLPADPIQEAIDAATQTDVGTGQGTGVPAGEQATGQESDTPITDALFPEYATEPPPAQPTEPVPSTEPPKDEGIGVPTPVETQPPTPVEQPSGVTTEDVTNIVNEAVSNIPPGMTSDDVRTIVNNAIGNIEFPEGMTEDQVGEIVKTAIGNIEFPPSVSEDQVNEIVGSVQQDLSDAITLGQEAAAEERLELQEAIIAVGGDITKLDEATQKQFEEFGESIDELFEGVGVDIEALQEGQISQAEAFAQYQEDALAQAEEAAEERADLQEAIIAVGGDITALDESTKKQFEEFGGTVDDLFSDVNVDIKALQEGQISQAEAQEAFQTSVSEQFGDVTGQLGEIGGEVSGLMSEVSGIGQGLEGLGQGIAGIGEGLGAGLLGLAAQQAMLPGQIAAATPIQPQKFEKFQRGLTRRKLADPLRIGMFTGGARSV
jgi:hypothetical protein